MTAVAVTEFETLENQTSKRRNPGNKGIWVSIYCCHSTCIGCAGLFWSARRALGDAIAVG